MHGGQLCVCAYLPLLVFWREQAYIILTPLETNLKTAAHWQALLPQGAFWLRDRGIYEADHDRRRQERHHHLSRRGLLHRTWSDHILFCEFMLSSENQSPATWQ
jgi:hypothetical protein